MLSIVTTPIKFSLQACDLDTVRHGRRRAPHGNDTCMHCAALALAPEISLARLFKVGVVQPRHSIASYHRTRNLKA